MIALVWSVAIACSESEFTSTEPTKAESERNSDLKGQGRGGSDSDSDFDGNGNGSGGDGLFDADSNNTDSRPIGDGATNSDLMDLVIEDGSQVRDLCASIANESHTQEIEFRYQGQLCPWNQGDNLDEDDGVITARIEQSVQLSLPDGAILCDFDLEFPVLNLEYDDHIYLLMNDYILAASKLPNGHFVQEGDLMKYEWLRLRGMRFNNENDVPVCLGQNEGGRCVIPETQSTGRFEIDVPEKYIAELAVKLREAEETHFRFVAGGDNDDDSDCKWDPIRFTARVDYIAP